MPLCCALAAQEGEVRAGFLEKVSTQRPAGGMRESGKVGALERWSQRREQQVEGQHSIPLAQEQVMVEAGDGSQAEELGVGTGPI